MKRYVYGTGLITVALLFLYLVAGTEHRPKSVALLYSLGLSAAVFTGLLIYYLLRRNRS